VPTADGTVGVVTTKAPANRTEKPPETVTVGLLLRPDLRTKAFFRGARQTVEAVAARTRSVPETATTVTVVVAVPVTVVEDLMREYAANHLLLLPSEVAVLGVVKETFDENVTTIAEALWEPTVPDSPFRNLRAALVSARRLAD
jgi:hypothetical protein